MYYGGRGIKRGGPEHVRWLIGYPRGGGGGGYSGFQVTGIDDRNILGALKFSVSGFLGEVKFGKYFSG